MAHQCSLVVAGLGFMGTNIALEALRLAPEFGLQPDNFICCDTNPERLQAFRAKAPLGVQFAADVRSALALIPRDRIRDSVLFNATNSPFHLGVLEQAVSAGVRRIYCEKPLVLKNQLEAASGLLADCVGASGYVINASEAVTHLRALMAQRKLLVLHVSATWEKNRMQDDRPTAGFGPDDLPHEVQLALSLVRQHQEILSIDVQGQVQTLPFTKPGVQEAANALGLFPLNPSLCAGALLSVKSNRPKLVTVNARGGFAGFEQTRRVEVLLSETERPQFVARLDFDTEGKDILRWRDLSLKDAPSEWAFPAQTKLARLLRGFFQLIFDGTRSPEIVTLDEALWMVQVEAAIEKSAEMRPWVTV